MQNLLLTFGQIVRNSLGLKPALSIKPRINRDLAINHLARALVFRHACKTSLTTILLGLETIAGQQAVGSAVPQSAANLQPVAITLSAAQHLAALIDQLGNSQAESPETFDIKNALITAITVAHRPGYEILHRIACDKSLQIRGSEIYFQEAIICLLANAQESYIQNATKPHPEPIMCLVSETENSKLKIEVIDSGRGMNVFDERRALLGGVSFKHPGGGIGLQFSKEVFTAMFGGSFQLTTKENLGTRVVITLPVTHKTDSQNPA